jgi:hypothetical protein
MLRVSPFPYSLRAFAIAFLASLHSSVNHGARVLPHLFGFFGHFIYISFTTPALIASYMIHVSIAAARSSFPIFAFATNFWNFSVNSVLPVHSSHFFADAE